MDSQIYLVKPKWYCNVLYIIRKNSGLRRELFSHRIHVWYIYLHLVDLFMVNVGKYAIHESFGFEIEFVGIFFPNDRLI